MRFRTGFPPGGARPNSFRNARPRHGSADFVGKKISDLSRRSSRGREAGSLDNSISPTNHLDCFRHHEFKIFVAVSISPTRRFAIFDSEAGLPGLCAKLIGGGEAHGIRISREWRVRSTYSIKRISVDTLRQSRIFPSVGSLGQRINEELAARF